MNVGANRQLAGEYGGRYIDASAGTVTGNWMEIHAVAPTILGAVSSNITNFPSVGTLQSCDSLPGVLHSVAFTPGALTPSHPKVD